MGERLSVKMREMEEILVVRAGRGQDQMAFFFLLFFSRMHGTDLKQGEEENWSVCQIKYHIRPSRQTDLLRALTVLWL